MKLSGGSTRKHAPKVRVLCAILVVITAFGIGGYFAYQQVQMAAQQKSTDEIIKVADARLAEIEKKKKEIVYITLPGADKIQAPAENFEDPSNVWTLVNKGRGLPTEYVPNGLIVPTVSVKAGVALDKQVRNTLDAPLTDMFAAAQAAGHSLMVGSAYRSAPYQDMLFKTYVAQSGYELADKYSAHPGFSEHQTGLAVDLSTTSQQCFLSECFIDTEDGQWLADNAYKYGFTLRYLKGKEAITGYNFEPWHYRYVGVSLATALHQSGISLDEAWPYIETALQTLRENKAVPRA